VTAGAFRLVEPPSLDPTWPPAGFRDARGGARCERCGQLMVSSSRAVLARHPSSHHCRRAQAFDQLARQRLLAVVYVDARAVARLVGDVVHTPTLPVSCAVPLDVAEDWLSALAPDDPRGDASACALLRSELAFRARCVRRVLETAEPMWLAALRSSRPALARQVDEERGA